MPNTQHSMSVAFQGMPGAYSHIACSDVFPDLDVLPCISFEDALAAVRNEQARYAMIPIENSLAGRVADIHHLLPDSGLHIIGEYYLPVHHHLLGVPGSRLEDIRTVYSHVHAIGQCRTLIRDLGLNAVIAADTAGSARDIASLGDPQVAAIASALAGEIHGLVSLKANVEDATHNTTRFVVMARTPLVPAVESGPVVTGLIFQVRNVPSALYKALGGFATNNVNMSRLESYQINGQFISTRFFAEIEGHPASPSMIRAMEELEFFSTEVRILGVWPAHPYRFRARNRDMVPGQ
ncbi:prephenate dehydratase [Haematospirillum jordaniae]|nr:prephenate dehydratase [Haematospirillum jordaniae]NKD85752.1 prephenate dehydratase [Haematospirillum jordaniae]NKD92511.1 prephenate dehydratase [Haematospirillum jordaniae]